MAVGQAIAFGNPAPPLPKVGSDGSDRLAVLTADSPGSTMRLHSIILPIAVAAAGFFPDLAAATIDLFPKEIVIDSGTASAQIINNGDRPEYVTISLVRLLNPGVPLKDEKLEPVGEAAQPTLYAFPFKLSLAPGQTKRIVLKPLTDVRNETVYRLNVQPEIKVLAGERQKATGTIVINLGFSALVRQLPAREREELSVVCDADGARLEAVGNVRYAVKDAKVDGEIVERFNVYPGVPRQLRGNVVEIPGQPACRVGTRGLGAGAAGSGSH